jgi:DNA-directed RNA polymerase specialized sigma24 family protein
MALSWTLSQQAFDRLLAALGPDATSAGERYERIRAKLTRLFEWRGCADAAHLVDLTFDRVARRLEEGAELTARDPYAYVHGVALHVLQEHWRAAGRTVHGLAEEGSHGELLVAPEVVEEEGAREREERLRCLERCLGALPVPSRRLLETYHEAAPHERIARRQALAAEQGVSLNALRIQVFRLRGRLQECVAACAGARAEGKRIGPARTNEREPSRERGEMREREETRR